MKVVHFIKGAGRRPATLLKLNYFTDIYKDFDHTMSLYPVERLF